MRHQVALAFVLLLVFGACGGGATAPKDTAAPEVDAPSSDYQPADPVDDPKGARIAPGAETIELVTDDGVVIQATAWSGTGDDAGKQAIVLVHQLASDRYEWAPFLEQLAGDYALVAIDLRGHGGSTRTTDGRVLQWRSFADKDWARIPLDVKAAVAYARGRGATSVGLVGASIGSSAVMLYAATDPQINAVALLSPGLAYRGLDTKGPVQAYGERPLLLLTSKGDTRSEETVRELGALAPEAERHVYDGERHGVSIRRDAPDLIEDVVGFFDAALD
ncbi:MAG TPA: alpha/beta fold hydrolase [Kofleriaceae bacterium]|nr:alpha/beta fold hydrolase [Kofleriaceae bacterium]